MTKSDGGFRIEHDSMGEVRVPFSAKYAVSTNAYGENYMTKNKEMLTAG